MKKSVQLSSSKYQIRYTEEFKRHICNEYLTGQYSKSELARKHSIGGGGYRITLWLRSFKYGDVHPAYNSTYMDNDLKEKAAKEKKTTTELESEIKRLKKELEDKHLQTEMYSQMIDIAEKEFGIDIRKK